jgi:aryl-alcohol dehydrogenase-like predicted oxidoreductase
MQRILLGKTGIEIPRLFIGTGTSDEKDQCIQARVKPELYAEILRDAYLNGINFWDTSDDYRTYSHLKLGMWNIERENLVISSKTYAGTAREALRVLNQSLADLGTKYLDIFFLHSVDSLQGYEKRIQDVLPGLKQAKEEGKIKAVGLSTHNIHVLEKAVEHPELEVIFSNFNRYEIHMDASIQWYSRTLEKGFRSGKGILVMKTLGEGLLRDRVKESIYYNLSKPFIHGVCVGIVSRQDLEKTLKVLKEIEEESS